MVENVALETPALDLYQLELEGGGRGTRGEEGDERGGRREGDDGREMRNREIGNER